MAGAGKRAGQAAAPPDEAAPAPEEAPPAGEEAPAAPEEAVTTFYESEEISCEPA